RPWQDYRQSYTSKKEMGGGIILDGSHELDLVRSLLGEVKSVFCAAGSLGGLGVEVEDTAEITLWFQSGALGSVHLDMAQGSRTGYCKLVGAKGTIILDFTETVVKWFSAATNEWQASPYPNDSNQTYIAEMKHFLECARSDKEPLISAHDGRAALQIALAAR